MHSLNNPSYQLKPLYKFVQIRTHFQFVKENEERTGSHDEKGTYDLWSSLSVVDLGNPAHRSLWPSELF